jgi:hypothetical protein
MTHHVTWETLNDFVDEVLPPDARAATASHVLQCATCRLQLDGLRRLTGVAHELSEAPAAGDADWERVARSISSGRRASPAAWWQRPRALAAAAVTLVALSSGLTALALRGRPDVALVTTDAPPSVAAPVSWRSAEVGYLASVEELRVLLETRRSSLSPTTVALIEQNLALIDSAIVESREALRRDPGNAHLADVLAASYRHKVELLRRATQLDARS